MLITQGILCPGFLSYLDFIWFMNSESVNLNRLDPIEVHMEKILECFHQKILISFRLKKE